MAIYRGLGMATPDDAWKHHKLYRKDRTSVREKYAAATHPVHTQSSNTTYTYGVGTYGTMACI